MKKFIFLFLIAGQTLFAQKINKDDLVAHIGKQSISKAELKYAFNKNRNEESLVTLDSLKSYLDNYINFKLKVYEAQKRGLDTTTAFKSELSGYLNQLKKPYEEGFDQETLAKEAYNRMQWEVKASHILLKIDANASPKDTLAVFQKLDSIKGQITDQASFESWARKASQDGSARKGGDLGWFSAFAMVYPFETAAFETTKGNTSQIIRSQFGYHLVFVTDKRKARGRIRTSHIFLSNRTRADEAAKQLAAALYDSLKAGSTWQDLVIKYSDDVQSKSKNGALPFADARQLPPTYFDAAYALKEGAITPPIQTSYGWHIIRLDKKEALPAFEQIKTQLEQQVARSGRNKLKELEVLKKLKAQYHFTPNPAFDSLLIKLDERAAIDELGRLSEETLFKIGNKDVLAQALIQEKAKVKLGTYRALYPPFEKEQILAYADSAAPYDYPAYGFLRQEYREGLLLFEIMQYQVWNKAIEDSLGQQRFYESNLSNYKREASINLYEISSNNTSSIDDIQKQLNALRDDERGAFAESFKNDELKIAKKIVALSELASFEGFNSAQGALYRQHDNLLLLNGDEVAAGYFAIEEIRGRVIADFQEKLDKDFINQLRKQTKLRINKKALKQLLSELD